MSGADARLARLLEPVDEGLGRMRAILEAQVAESSRAVSDMMPLAGGSPTQGTRISAVLSAVIVMSDMGPPSAFAG